MENIVKIDLDEDLYSLDEVGRLAFFQFGIRYLFPWQRMVIENILEAYKYLKLGITDTDDFSRGRQIVLLPTGAGKSLCFQIPSFLLEGPTLVIYPLLALMADQQRRMQEGGLECVVFRGGQSEEIRRENFLKIKKGAKIILANPEVLKSEGLLNELAECKIQHIAIDEAHCVSEWGDSFRPSYLELGKVIEKLNPPVITAFTATASPEVLSRVSEILFGGEAHIVRSESDRPNIHYYVRECVSKKNEAIYLSRRELRPMIIFCGTRNNCEDMALELNMCFGQETARFYHAGLEKSEKDSIEKWFYNSKDGVLCATCAYGMGVDKKDIKTVIHLEAPSTAEAYIQEAGRGGRDGSVAKAILLWSLSDSVKYSSFKKGSREAAMKDFAETLDCRRQVLLDALGAEQAYCSGCDLCNERRGLCKSENHSDWKTGYKLIKRGKFFYDRDSFEEKVGYLLNQRALSELGLKIFNHTDCSEITEQLILSGKIAEKKTIFWKGRLFVPKKNKKEADLSDLTAL